MQGAIHAWLHVMVAHYGGLGLRSVAKRSVALDITWPKHTQNLAAFSRMHHHALAYPQSKALGMVPSACMLSEMGAT